MSVLRWTLGLLIPVIALILLAACGILVESQTHYGSTWLGRRLLSDNAQRERTGALWEGILASRRSRTTLATKPSADSLHFSTIPDALLGFEYELVRHGDLLRLETRARPEPLILAEIASHSMQQLASSLQAYGRGRSILNGIRLSREAYRSKAHILAQTSLNDGSIFPLLHRHLLHNGRPEAWNFVKMTFEDEMHWRAVLRSILARWNDGETRSAEEEVSIVESTCRELIEGWIDSLYSAERDKILHHWEVGANLEVRLTRNLDSFVGYALFPHTPPIRLAIDGNHIAKAFQPPQSRHQ